MKVYFNNSCKICKAEIDLYKKEKIQEIDWVDITANELAVKETSKNSKELLRRLHVKEGEKVLEGAEAFLLLWKKIPKYKFLYNFFRLPIIFSIFSFTYEIVAFFLYLKNKKQLKNQLKKNNKNLLSKDIEAINITSTIEYINITILFFFLLNLTKSLSSKSEISRSPTTG